MLVCGRAIYINYNKDIYDPWIYRYVLLFRLVIKIALGAHSTVRVQYSTVSVPVLHCQDIRADGNMVFRCVIGDIRDIREMLVRSGRAFIYGRDRYITDPAPCTEQQVQYRTYVTSTIRIYRYSLLYSTRVYAVLLRVSANITVPPVRVRVRVLYMGPCVRYRKLGPKRPLYICISLRYSRYLQVLRLHSQSVHAPALSERACTSKLGAV